VTDLTPGMKRLGRLEEGLVFDVARDGSVVFAANSTEPPYRALNSDLFLVPAGGGAPRNLTADNPAEDGSPVFSPDGATIAYGREAKGDGFPDRTRLALLDVATGKTTVLTEGWDQVPEGWSFTRDGKTLVFRSEAHARTNVYALPVAGGTPRLVWKGGRATAAEVAGAGEVVLGYTTFRRPTELAAVKVDDPDPVERRRCVAAAKELIGRAGRFVGQQAIQLHGGMGMTDELAVGHYVKRLTAIDTMFGDADHQLERFATAAEQPAEPILAKPRSRWKQI